MPSNKADAADTKSVAEIASAVPAPLSGAADLRRWRREGALLRRPVLRQHEGLVPRYMTEEQFRALSLDLDETLLDGRLLQDSISETCQRIAAFYPPLEVAQLLAANSQAWQSYWPSVEASWTLGTLDGASVGLEAWRRTLEVCGCRDHAAVQFAAQTHAGLARRAHRVFEDVAAALKAARNARVRLALVTNGASDTQREKLRVLELEHWFDAVIISGEIGAAKPDAAVFDIALKELGVQRHEMWHVGDSLSTDVAGARAAGITSVWLNRRGVPRDGDALEPHLEIRSLSELFERSMQ